VLYEVRFGSSASAPSLRILNGEFPVDEPAWCRIQFSRSTDSGGSAGLGNRLWKQFELGVEGPEPVEVGQLKGRSYVVARPRAFTLRFQWIFLDLKRGQRVLEFASECQRWAGDEGQFKKVVETIEFLR
jgi:hypothetical protein